MRHLDQDLLADTECSQEQREQARALNALGEESLEEGFFRMAELQFLEAFHLHGSNPLYELNLGRAILGNPTRAAAQRARMARVHLELVVKRVPYNPVARYYLAQCQAESGDQLNARLTLATALEIKPDFHEASRLLAKLGGPRKPAVGTRRKGLFGWLRPSG